MIVRTFVRLSRSCARLGNSSCCITNFFELAGTLQSGSELGAHGQEQLLLCRTAAGRWPLKCLPEPQRSSLGAARFQTALEHLSFVACACRRVLLCCGKIVGRFAAPITRNGGCRQFVHFPYTIVLSQDCGIVMFSLSHEVARLAAALSSIGTDITLDTIELRGSTCSGHVCQRQICREHALRRR